MKQKITDNLGLKILAVIFSVILWLIAININDPVTQESYNVTVQLQNLTNLTSSGKYVEVMNNTDSIKVTVRGSRTVLSSFTEKNIVATADVSKINSNNQVPIEVSTTRISDRIESIRPDKQYVQLSIENIGKQQIPINVNVQNEPGEGYIFGSAATTQNVVIISGPESKVSEVAYAAVEINVDGATSDVNISLPIHLYNSKDDILDTSKITMSMNEVYTTASILQTKNLPIVCAATGVLPDGYALTGVIDSVPAYITLAGRSSVMKNLTAVEVSEPIDVSGYDSDVNTEVDLKPYLPEGTSIVGGNEAGQVNVTVHIEKETVREFRVDTDRIHTTGIPEGLTIELDEEENTLRVELQGLKALLSAIDSGSIVGIVDVDRYMSDEGISEIKEGNYTMPVSFTLPEGVKLTREYRVRVKVKSTE